MGMAVQEGWKSLKVSPPTDIVQLAGDIKTWLQTIIGNHKRAVVYLDFDWTSGNPTTNRQLVSAVLYDGFEKSFFTRYNSSSSFGGYGTLPGGTDYWTNSYAITALTTDVYIVFIDMNS